MIRRPPRSTLSSSSAASDVYKRQLLGTSEFQDVPTSKYEGAGLSSKKDLPTPFVMGDYALGGVFAPRRHYHPLSAYAHEEWGRNGAGDAPLMDPKVLTLERFLNDVLVRVFVAQRYTYYVCGEGHDRFLVGAQEVLEGLLVYGRCVLTKVDNGTPSQYLCPNNVVDGARGYVVRDVVQKVTDALCSCLEGCGRRSVAMPGGLKRECKDWVRHVGSMGLLSLIHISEPTRLLSISYAVFCLKKKKNN
eukprot:TRINITY_DN24876_c0_g1_i1.p1 TRINITY_DN24876_c0_g1~~TRINITY_DN24876_c0_g1_i1.p1  ORF type:complete len:247 (-),score=61.72 TRINITY_DN24876_c0_g1_i1:78-818(-)